MLNLPILPILIALPLVGLAFVLLSPEGMILQKSPKNQLYGLPQVLFCYHYIFL